MQPHCNSACNAENGRYSWSPVKARRTTRTRNRARTSAPTRNDVARAAGVSPATASLALNNHPRVAAETKRRVAEAARQLGFSFAASFAARKLARTRFDRPNPRLDQVGLIYCSETADPVDPGCLAMMRDAEHELSANHTCLVFVRAGQSAEWDKVRRLADTGIVDAWLVTGAVSDTTVNRLKPLRLPYVVLGDHRCSQPVHCVNADNVAVGRLAVHRLASLGHRRIAFIGGIRWFVYQEEIVQGMQAAARDLGLDCDDRLTAHRDFWQRPDARGVAAWLRDLGGRTTAVFCDSQLKAEMLVRALRESGLRVPEDMSVLVCGADLSLTLFDANETWTRIERPVGEIGRQGAALLQRMVSEPRTPHTQIRLAAPWIDGWSVAPASSAAPGNQRS